MTEPEVRMIAKYESEFAINKFVWTGFVIPFFGTLLTAYLMGWIPTPEAFRLAVKAWVLR